jgi:hypothetical protein
MDSAHRSRFIVSVEQNYALSNFVAVITCSDDVPRMHLLAELPPLGSVATGAIAGLFMRKLELCCLQVRPSPCLIAPHPSRCCAFAAAVCRLTRLPRSSTSRCRRTQTQPSSASGRRRGMC